LTDEAITALLAQEQELFFQRQTLQDELIKAKAVTLSGSGGVIDLEQQLAKVEATYQQVQDAIAARGTELASLVPGRSADYVLGVDKVQPLLDQETTLISYYLLENRLLAFILTSDDFQTVALDVDPADLVNQIVAFRDFPNLDVAYPDSAVSLYNGLIEPLKEHLTKPHLIIIPHQVLHYLPFAALTDGPRYLIDDYTITTLPNASALPFIQENIKLDTPPYQPTLLILGNPVTGDFDATAPLVTRDQLGSLAFAEKEAKDIAELFGVEPLLGEVATETAIHKHASTVTILHLAAHGIFNPVAPLNSLIALAPDRKNDGWLTVGEVYGLDLNQTDLVVLSACQTNLGDLSAGDELVGLTRSFIFAGTPSVIASLWAVEDKSTDLLMERFYTHLGAGMGKAAALRQAQFEVREKYPNPYYWSAFVLSGDGGRSLTAQRLANPAYQLWFRLHKPRTQPWVWGTLLVTTVTGLYIALARRPERSIIIEKYGRRVQTLVRDPRFSKQVRGLGVAISAMSLAFIVIYLLW
jgi:CHAT domain-containing protein